MSASTLNIGCQTYTWQMSFDRYTGRLDHILQVIEEAGFAGFEPETCMMGQYYKDPQLLHNELAKRHLKMGAICLALPWRDPQESKTEAEEAEEIFRYLQHFPQALLCLVQLPFDDRNDLPLRQKNALQCVNAVAKRATKHGIHCAFHPNSPPGSVFRTEEDYNVMFNGLDSRYVGYAPDTGHIAKGGMDPFQVIREHRDIIRHVHYKDITADGQWTAMGKGVIDHPGITRFLEETGYNGWIMVEEESVRAESEPDQVTLENGIYAKAHL